MFGKFGRNVKNLGQKKKCSHRELNPRPSADLDKCKADALPTEL